MSAPEMSQVDPDEILGMTFEVNEGPRWIDTIQPYSGPPQED